jgi:hypothetical protein
MLHIDAERLLRTRPVKDLEAWFLGVVIRQHQDEAAIKRLTGERRRKRDGKSGSCRTRGLPRADGGEEAKNQKAGTKRSTDVTHGRLPERP